MRFKNMTLGIGVPKDATPEQLMELRVEAVEWLQAYFNDSLDAARGERRSRRRHDRLADDHRGRGRAPHAREHPRHPRLADDRRPRHGRRRRSRACSATSPRHPDRRAEVVADPSMWPDVVEELMRFESPVTDGGRIAMKDMVLPSGETIAEGTHMNISWSAANLDPDYFPDPLTVDFRRKPNPHIAFASGFHRCLGSHLARMELRVALEAFHQRIPNYADQAGRRARVQRQPAHAAQHAARLALRNGARPSSAHADAARRQQAAPARRAGAPRAVEHPGAAPDRAALRVRVRVRDRPRARSSSTRGGTPTPRSTR